MCDDGQRDDAVPPAETGCLWKWLGAAVACAIRLDGRNAVANGPHGAWPNGLSIPGAELAQSDGPPLDPQPTKVLAAKRGALEPSHDDPPVLL